MKNLAELGFGPPNLNLPTGECRNGHPWAENAMVHVSEKRGRIRTCLSCREAATRKRSDKRAGARTKMRGEVLENFLGKGRKAKA